MQVFKSEQFHFEFDDIQLSGFPYILLSSVKSRDLQHHAIFESPSNMIWRTHTVRNSWEAKTVTFSISSEELLGKKKPKKRHKEHE